MIHRWESLRLNATDAAGAEVRRAVNRVLHPPTLALRQGLPVDEAAVLRQVEAVVRSLVDPPP